MALFVDLAGQTFGELKALEVVGKTKHGSMIWRCLCIPCGREDITATSNLLRTGQKVNCGCTWGKRHAKHGMCGTPEYIAYGSAKRRCKRDSNYKGRIEFRFKSFPEFLDAIGPRPDKLHSLDRIDNDGHYEKGNVRWATRGVQNRNQRSVGVLQLRINRLEKEIQRLKSGPKGARKRKFLGRIGVDSGFILVADPCYDIHGSKPSCHAEVCGPRGLALALRPPDGDGLYPVFEEYDEEGHTVRFVIEDLYS
jgi:hypothetical protein